MSQVVQITKELERIVSTLWNFNLAVDLRPFGAPVPADLSTDLCIRAADLLGQTPEALGRQIIAKLDPEFIASANVDQGYLNFTLKDLPALTLTRPALSADTVQICLIAPEWSKVPWAGVRLLALALIQTYLVQRAGGQAQLYVGKQRIEVAQNGAGLAGALRLGIRNLASSDYTPITEALQIAEFLDRHTAANKTLWFTPKSLPRNQFLTLYRKLKSDSQIALQCPEWSWFAPSYIEESVEQVVTWSDQELAALCVYLSLTTRAGDLDLVIPRNNESSNLLWYLETLKERLNSVKIERGVGTADCLESSLDRTLHLQLNFFSDLYKRAALRGEVREFIGVIEDLTRRFSRQFNSPSMRLRLESGQASPYEKDILAGVLEVISAMMGFKQAFGTPV